MSRVKLIGKKKSAIFIIAGVGYLALILFFNFSFGVVDKGCRFHNNCIQFCCEDQEVCDENNIKNFLNENYDSFYVKCNGTFSYKNEISSCTEESIYRGSLSSHGKDRKIIFDEKARKNDNYCTKDYSKGSVTFDFDLTTNQSFYRKIFDYFFFVSSILLMTITALTPIFIKKLIATLTGKIEFCLMMSLMFFFVSISSWSSIDSKNKISIFLMAIGVFSSTMWITIMSYDVWRTTRKVQATPDRYFRVYCYLVFGIAGGMSGVLLWSSFYTLATYSITFLICVLIFVCSVIIGYVFIFKTRNILNKLSDDRPTWFETQLDRWWMSYQLFMIFGAVVVFREKAEKFRTESYFIYSSAVSCYSEILVFLVFAVRKEVREIFRRNNPPSTNV